ncbi:DUF1835 domain-containing protein [Burkholderia multivorans]|uniref:DUF1835 domain-containing protein n=1 Tax=Burkholderia multivorans TaxID=87883 RepID=UPI000D00B27A|nr:DUF1835 domain-containing protein [Burkholderia multivorans]MBR7901203.1 DUF1835 domain-containing protein [Burkholderia multivorans]PRF44391.1 hypothetical protein C6Q10_03850 [Burkholderia multivorans]RAA20466.1 DUF1835 domain-containing protein [Burkholderia multivorans]RAA21808.1 DUF1835 domain-containing protein [Burkholderia multivorans]RAA25729.1 DUF1835 domain-containing protein [Burkholderia multivorans]
MSTIHVIQGGTAAASLREALAAAGRDERVVGLLDDLGVGPLKGADETSDVRAAFWQRVLGDQIPDWKAEIEGEFARLDQLATDTGQVVVWHAPCVGDKLLLRRVAYHLRSVPQRLNEVRLSAADLDATQRTALARADHACSTGMFSPTQLGKRRPAAAPISVLRIGRLALEWQEAKHLNAELRYWISNTIKSGHYADLDAQIVARASADWQPARQLVGRIMAEADRGGLFVSDAVAWWRCRELAAVGRLELQDDAPAALSFTHVRAARAANASR